MVATQVCVCVCVNNMAVNNFSTKQQTALIWGSPYSTHDVHIISIDLDTQGRCLPISCAMFKRFSKDEVSGHTQLKASVQRAIRSAD